jgi:Fe-S cluster assembly ATP-binding protein
MLKITNLSAKFAEQVILRDVNLSVKNGEMHVILGPNGSGKSTLGKVVLGDPNYEIIDGEIFLHDKKINDLPTNERVQQGFFITWQSPPELTGIIVKNFLFAAAKALQLPNAKSAYKFHKALKIKCEKLNFPIEFLEREVNQGFSGGERKKMELLSLLTLGNGCAFLDEIDSGVDVDALKIIAEGIKEYMQNSDNSAIIVSHSSRLLSTLKPTHVHIFFQGKIIKSGGAGLIKEIDKNGFTSFLPAIQIV